MPNVTVIEEDLHRLSVNGKEYNSIIAALASVKTPAEKEEVENAVFVAFAALHQRANTAVQDRRTAKDEAMEAEIADLKARIAAAEDKHHEFARHLSTAAETHRAAIAKKDELIQILQLPSAEQQKALLLRERDAIAERIKQIEAHEASLAEPPATE